jgi:hypothetical protein
MLDARGSLSLGRSEVREGRSGGNQKNSGFCQKQMALHDVLSQPAQSTSVMRLLFPEVRQTFIEVILMRPKPLSGEYCYLLC